MSFSKMKSFPLPHEAADATLSRRRRHGSLVLALLVVLGVTGCTGGAGLDVPVGPVDHSCPVANSCEHR